MYRRPHVAFPEYRDAAGLVIPYGSRWADAPAEDSYSVTRHPERFEVAVTVARAIVDYLVATYDVDVIDGVDPGEGRAFPDRVGVPRADAPGEVAARRRLVPRGPGAPLTVVETDYPGVNLLAGATLSALAPHCGCDACDESVEELADTLEQFAFAVAGGSVRERLRGSKLQSGFELPGVGSQDGWSRVERGEQRQIREALAVAPAFEPWRLRQ